MFCTFFRGWVGESVCACDLSAILHTQAVVCKMYRIASYIWNGASPNDLFCYCVLMHMELIYYTDRNRHTQYKIFLSHAGTGTVY